MSTKRPEEPIIKPRVLVVTPEITYLPEGMGNMAQRMKAKAGGLADVSASLVASLHGLGADVHVALPNYRQMFNMDVFSILSKELREYHQKLPSDRIHLAEDRIFYYRDEVYSSYEGDNWRIALIFQREVINNIIPRVRPDLIHCNDWMTGLIPAMARRQGIPCLFTVHNIHTELMTLEIIENSGIDVAEFWQGLYFTRPPGSYEETRWGNPVDMLVSGVFGAHFINTVSPSFLNEVADGQHDFVPPPVQREIANKRDAGCARGILNAPDPSYDPETDPALRANYTEETHREGKRKNKAAFQKRVGLTQNPEAPLFFWPSRLDPMQKGCELVTNLLYEFVDAHRQENVQIGVVANGQHQRHFHDIVRMHDLAKRVAVYDFNESLSRLGYAAADFVIMPSRFEPCGLPQMVSTKYGTLPIVHRTGGLRDTITHVQGESDSGNGFVFEVYDTGGLRWAMEEAMKFYRLPEEVRARQIARVMEESKAQFNHETTARAYFEIYESMVRRPLFAGAAGP